MVTIAVQFLEDSPELKEITPQAVRECLHEAFNRLPISILLLGWNIPEAIFEVVVEETARAKVRLYRWQPLLTGDGSLYPHPEWQVVGLDNAPVKGFRGLPEFTFMCPNKPAVREAVTARLREVLLPPYQGVFLDRIRFPSPAADPFSHLACCCEDCCRTAQEQEGLDLAEFQYTLNSYGQASGAGGGLIASLFRNIPADMPKTIAQGLRLWFHFRNKSIAQFTRLASELASSRGMEVGLDCFSPCLTWMVGQDLEALGHVCNWIKVMTYAHALGPAGLPFELMELAAVLQDRDGVSEEDALAFLEDQTGFSMPRQYQSLRSQGLSPDALVAEIGRARALGVRPLFVGLELVDLPGISDLKDDQIRRDWKAVLNAGVEGVVLSWDLWHMSLERLQMVSDILENYS